jgi:glycosyltransferase involved in cell wall biosynthesis
MGEVVRLNARVLREAGHEVTVALPPTPSLRLAIEPYATTIVDIPCATRRSVFGRMALPMHRLVRTVHPDILHYHVPHSRWALDALITAHLARRVKVVRTEHNPLMTRPEQPYRSLLRVADAAVDRFVYVSIGNKERWERFAPWRDRGSVVVNVIDPDRVSEDDRSASVDDALAVRRGLPSGSRAAMFIAGMWSLDDHEGRRPLAPVLHAMAALPPVWHLFVAGSGEIQRAASMAEQLGLGGRVHFVGPTPNASALTATCEILVSASHFEGLSVSYLEAWYAGVPVLCADVDGIVDVVGDAAADIVVPHGDAGAFARRWLDVSDPSSAFMQANDAAIAAVRQSFLVDRFSTDTHRVYASVLQ